MKKILISLAAVLAAVATSQAGSPAKNPVSFEEVNHWYVAAYGGMSIYQTGFNHKVGSGLGFPINTHQSRKVGWDTGVKVGYDFNPQAFVRPVVEVEALFGAFNRNYGTRDINGVSLKGESFSEAILANGLVKFDCGAWQPYLGAGLGVYGMQIDAKVHVAGVPFAIKDSGSATGFAWQLLAGTDYKLTSNWAVFAEYKWLNYQIANHKNKPFTGADAFADRIGQQIVNLGVRYSF